MNFMFWAMLGAICLAAVFYLPAKSKWNRVAEWTGITLMGVTVLVWRQSSIMEWILLALLIAAAFALRQLIKGKIKFGFAQKQEGSIGSNGLIGSTGVVVWAHTADQIGLVRFIYPVDGKTDWPYIADGHIVVGDHVQVVQMIGEKVMVKKTHD